MAEEILADCTHHLNCQSNIREQLSFRIHQAKSLIRIAMNADIHDYPPSVVCDCYCVIDDLLDEAVRLSNKLE